MIKLGSTSINEIKLGNTNINRVYQGNNLVFQYLPESLRSNLVLWYDLSLQGATNQSMAADPRLLDLSGNGHHATCQGFAWTETSGVNMKDYPHALVADGVGGKAVMYSGFPILADYTVIAKRDPQYNIMISNRNAGDTDEDGAFQVERVSSRSEVSTSTVCWNFGYKNDLVRSTDSIIWQTRENYCGTPITAGTAEAQDVLALFTFAPSAKATYKGIFYSLLIFDRSLSDDEIAWVKENMIQSNEEEVDWYGVEFDTTLPSPDCIRIGNPELHKTLPVHTQMQGCLLADDGTVNKYLNESDWTSETRDGSQGQVMVEMPKLSYWKFETDGNIRRIKFSTKPLDGFTLTPQGYVSAYEASLQRSTNTLCSVVNTDVDYRGGNNNTEWDDTYRSQLGMPATNINLNNFRTYARNRKAGSSEWNCMTYDMQKLLYWLFVVEYATLNTQKTFEANKDVNGYAQGGLGVGVTTLNNTKWVNYNDTNPFIPCGYTDELGNSTGEVEFSMPTEYDSAELTVKVPRYRGVENPFGHLWQWTDGCKCLIQSEADGELSEFYVCDDPAAFTSSGTTNYELRGNLPRVTGYKKGNFQRKR